MTVFAPKNVYENMSRTSCRRVPRPFRPRKGEAKMASPRAGARARDTRESGFHTRSERLLGLAPRRQDRQGQDHGRPVLWVLLARGYDCRDFPADAVVFAKGACYSLGVIGTMTIRIPV